MTKETNSVEANEIQQPASPVPEVVENKVVREPAPTSASPSDQVMEDAASLVEETEDGVARMSLTPMDLDKPASAIAPEQSERLAPSDTVILNLDDGKSEQSTKEWPSLDEGPPTPALSLAPSHYPVSAGETSDNGENSAPASTGIQVIIHTSKASTANPKGRRKSQQTPRKKYDVDEYVHLHRPLINTY